MLSEINGQLIKKQRGTRSLKKVSEASGYAFSDVALMKWEQGKAKPKNSNISALLKALECEIDDITAVVDLGLN